MGAKKTKYGKPGNTNYGHHYGQKRQSQRHFYIKGHQSKKCHQLFKNKIY